MVWKNANHNILFMFQKEPSPRFLQVKMKFRKLPVAFCNEISISQRFSKKFSSHLFFNNFV